MGAEIFQGFLQQPKSVMDFENEYADAAARRQNNALRAMAMQQQVDTRNDAMATQNALRTAAGGWTPETTIEQRIDSLRRNPRTFAAADALAKQHMEQQKTTADIGKTAAETAEKNSKLLTDSLTRYRDNLNYVDSPQAAARWVQAQHNDPTVAPFMNRLGSAEQMIAAIPTDPAGFQKWRETNAAGITKVMEMAQDWAKAKLTSDTSIQTTRMNNDTSVRTTGMNNATSLATNASSNATSRANNRDTIAAENSRHDATLAKTPPKPTDQQQKAVDATEALALLDQAEPLINKATSSYAGAGVDKTLRAVGVSTDSGDAAAQLRALEGALISKMPKMSGPQSDKDVLLYKQMAGQIGDATVPASQKRAAIKTIREINQRQSGASAAPAAPAGGPSKVRNDADYAALPSGATFVGPDGKTRRKP